MDAKFGGVFALAVGDGCERLLVGRELFVDAGEAAFALSARVDAGEAACGSTRSP